MKKRFWKSDWFAGLVISLGFLFAINSTSQKCLVNNVFLMRVGHCLMLLISYLSMFKAILIPIKLLISSCILKFQRKYCRKDQQILTQLRTYLELAN